MSDLPSSSFDSSNKREETLKDDILVGENFEKIAPILEETFQRFDDSTDAFTRKFLIEDNSQLDMYKLQEMMVGAENGDMKSEEELAIDDLEFVNSLKNIFEGELGRDISAKLEKLVSRYPDLDIDDINYISRQQEDVLKGWLIYNAILLMEKLRSMQVEAGEGAEAMYFPFPQWNLQEVIADRNTTLKRLLDRRGREIEIKFGQRRRN